MRAYKSDKVQGTSCEKWRVSGLSTVVAMRKFCEEKTDGWKYSRKKGLRPRRRTPSGSAAEIEIAAGHTHITYLLVASSSSPLVLIVRVCSAANFSPMTSRCYFYCWAVDKIYTAWWNFKENEWKLQAWLLILEPIYNSGLFQNNKT